MSQIMLLVKCHDVIKYTEIPILSTFGTVQKWTTLMAGENLQLFGADGEEITNL